MTTALDRNPVNDLAKSRIPTRRKTNKTGEPTKADVRTTAEETPAAADRTRAVKAVRTPAKKGAQATGARIHRNVDIGRITAETDSMGRATEEASRIAHPAVQPVETAATTTGETGAEARCRLML